MSDKEPPFEVKASREPTKVDRARHKLYTALSGHSPVSKNTLIKEAIKLLEGK